MFDDRPTALAATVCALGILATPGRSNAREVTFVAIGDTPYRAVEQARIDSHVQPAIVESGVPFVVHHGDFKSGGEPCPADVAGLTAVRDRIEGLHPGPVFYTPGDNEWTDCDRGPPATARSELDALDRLRAVFFDAPPVPPGEEDAWAFARQPGFPENARWMHGGVQFATVHLVSTNNGRIQINLDYPEVALARVEARDFANTQWLVEVFRAAGRADAGALVVVTQADVTKPDGGGACTASNRRYCDAFAAFRAQLAALASGFRGGRGAPLKPVLLLHGDTNPYCLDRGFGGARAPNLWRLNAWGDFKSPADATLVTVQPADAAEPFVVETLVGKVAPEDGC